MTQTHCHVMRGSLIDGWTEELEIEQHYDQSESTCLNVATWIMTEGTLEPQPICTTHKAVIADHEDYDPTITYELMSHVIAEEEDELDQKVEFLFAKASQMAKQFPGYDPNRERVTPNIDHLLKEGLKEALRKK